METYTADGRLKTSSSGSGGGGSDGSDHNLGDHADAPMEAADVTIADSGGLYTATDVEAALAEVQAELDAHEALANAGHGWTVVTKTIDESVASSTTEQSDNELLFPIGAANLIEFELRVIYANAAGSAPDLKHRIIGPTGCVGMYHVIGLSTTDAASNNQGLIGTAPAATTLGTGIAKRLALFRGFALTGGTAGDVIYQWCQNTSNITATIVYAGSWLQYRVLV